MKTNIGLSLLLLICSYSYGQLSTYRYAQPLQEHTAQWHAIALPTAIFKHLNTDLSDLRVYGVTAENDTIEAPYLLRQAKSKQSRTAVAALLRNQSHNEKGYYFTFEIPNQKVINQIELQFKVQNFDWNVTVEGSHNQQEWFTVQENYRIVSLHNELTDYEFTTVKFPKSDYRYFRLRVDSKKQPEFSAATVVLDEVIEGRSISYSGYTWKSELHKSDKKTELTIDLKSPVPINTIAVSVRDTFDYYRPVKLYYSSDSIQTEKGWRDEYRMLASGTLSAIANNTFECSSTLANKLKISIANQDNAPLKIDTVQVSGYVYEMITRFTTPATYYLAYGNEHVNHPNYDIAVFEDHIPKEIKTLALGEVIAIAKPEIKASPLFENKAWLWGILILILGLLLVFSLKMLKKETN